MRQPQPQRELGCCCCLSSSRGLNPTVLPPRPRPWPPRPAGDFFERAAAPLKELLRRNNVTSADVAAVELLGGSSRVPRLKQALSDALGGRALDM